MASLDLTNPTSWGNAVPQLSFDTAFLDMSHPSIPSGCWPMTRLLNYRMFPSYSGSPCDKANQTAQGVVGAATTVAVASFFTTQGMTGIAHEPSGAVMQQFYAAFEKITCDGDPLLTEAVNPWVLNAGLRQAVQGLCIASSALALLLVFVVLRYRALPVFRSASVPFLVMILFGLAMAFLSIQYWVAPATARDCAAFNWLLNLGFSLSFGPLFAKVWRVWRIFGRQALRVVKINNWMLASMVAVLLAFDTIVLSVWQASHASWTAVTIYQVSSDQLSLISYTQCAPRSDGSDTAYLALIGISKLLLLLFGAVMGLATRNVAQTFNESKQIAYALYSTCFTLAVVLAITIGLTLLGDALIAIVALGLWWVFLSVLCCLFIPKLVELRDKLKADYSVNHSVTGNTVDQQHKTQSLDFSFPSLALIPAEQIRRYVVELRTQLKGAEGKMRSLGITLPPGGLGPTHGYINHGNPSEGGHSSGGCLLYTSPSPRD